MVAENILKYVGLTIDGRGYAGKLESYNAPVPTLSLEELRAGGMDAAIDIEMGMEKLTSSFVLTSYDPDVLSLWGVKKGSGFQCTARGSFEDLDGTTRQVVHKMTGKLISIERGTWGSGNKPSLTCAMTLKYYQEVHAGRVIYDIDVPNMIRIVDGVDQLAEHRANIGL